MLGKTSKADLPATVFGEDFHESLVHEAARADLVLRPARYTAVVDGNTSTIVTTWPVRPSLVIGAAFDLTFGN